MTTDGIESMTIERLIREILLYIIDNAEFNTQQHSGVSIIDGAIRFHVMDSFPKCIWRSKVFATATAVAVSEIDGLVYDRSSMWFTYKKGD